MYASETAPIRSVRAFIQARHGDTWDEIAARVFPDEPREEAIQQLMSWNLFLAFRPGDGCITPSDIVFVEAPQAQPLQSDGA